MTGYGLIRGSTNLSAYNSMGPKYKKKEAPPTQPPKPSPTQKLREDLRVEEAKQAADLAGKRPEPSGRNLQTLILLTLGFPGIGKTELAHRLKEHFSSSDVHVQVISSDAIRAQEMQQHIALGHEGAFCQSRKEARKKLAEEVASSLKSTHLKQLIFIDKNLTPSTLPQALSFLKGCKNADFRVVAIAPSTRGLWKVNSAFYPFSVFSLVESLTRLKQRPSHETLIGSYSFKVGVALKKFQTFRGCNLEKLAESHNIQLLRVPFTDEKVRQLPKALYTSLTSLLAELLVDSEPLPEDLDVIIRNLNLEPLAFNPVSPVECAVSYIEDFFNAEIGSRVRRSTTAEHRIPSECSPSIEEGFSVQKKTTNKKDSAQTDKQVKEEEKKPTEAPFKGTRDNLEETKKQKQTKTSRDQAKKPTETTYESTKKAQANSQKPLDELLKPNSEETGKPQPASTLPEQEAREETKVPHPSQSVKETPGQTLKGVDVASTLGPHLMLLLKSSIRIVKEFNPLNKAVKDDYNALLHAYAPGADISRSLKYAESLLIETTDKSSKPAVEVHVTHLIYIPNSLAAVALRVNGLSAKSSFLSVLEGKADFYKLNALQIGESEASFEKLTMSHEGQAADVYKIALHPHWVISGEFKEV
mmetsp:Transcript_6618/g.11640  ORF Transcript_6618/g.11640 Transcript_6618/m.11640 type:complete len:642 (+) Transcript_6618:1254-3179(+)